MFQEPLYLRQEVPVDESIIGFKVRLWFIQYMPKKPTQWRMKAFMLGEGISENTHNWT